ncbi:structure-specific endonuclease subunit SLX4 [Hetaerina americana]|uniref:structure-specific endonuclease subunit SLX4 n=1 Tax=Hetaerina americana TaxID=62018 RepID=UPI003A7F5551
MEKEVPLCSQTFFVSQRTRNNKLSLTVKSMNKSKESVTNSSKNKLKVQRSGRGRSSSTSISRRGGNGSHATTMDKYFGTLDSSSSGTQLESENEPSASSFSDILKSPTGIINILPNLSCGSSIIEANGDLPRPVISPNSGQSNADVVPDSALETQVTSSATRKNDEQRENGGSTLCKPKEDRTDILMCPICWKSFECKDSQTTHMKQCAVKHKMTTKQLLDALELIQKQEAERQSLGLPLLASKAPKKPKKEPTSSSMKPKTTSDGYLQLGLALSASLQDAEREKEREHLLEAGLIEEANEKGLLPTQEISENLPVKPAPIFCNFGKKSGNEIKVTSKVRRRNDKYGFGGKVPAILRRTVEERERLITEKVAIILVGDETGASRSDSLKERDAVTAWEIGSKELKKYVDKENVWWMLASASPLSVSQNQYYVNGLAEFITPSKVVAGAKLKHLSQIPGRNNTPIKPPSKMHSEREADILLRCMPSPCSIPESEKSVHNSSKKHGVKRNLFCQSPKVNTKNSLSHDWNNLIGKKEMSDLTIFTKGDHKIHAHKLVFYVRCPNVLKDIVKEERRGNVTSEMLIWIDICYSAVMAFLQFIYCGVLSEVSTLKECVVEDLRQLAIRYDLVELQMALDSIISSFGANKVEMLGGMTNCLIMTDQAAESGCSKSEGDDSHSQITLPKVGSYEASSLLNPENKEMRTPLQLVMKSSAKKKIDGDDDHNEVHDDRDEVHDDHDELCPPNSFPPSANAPTPSSPDIFQGSILNSPGSPKSIMIVKEVHADNKGFDDGHLSQSSRSSIEYLVSLIEKDSESSEVNMEVKDTGISTTYVQDEIMGSPCDSEKFNLCNDSVDWDDDSLAKAPETPPLVDKTTELIVYPTPAPSKEIPSGESEEPTVPKESNLLNDSKRKFVTCDSSDSSTPTTKKLCLLGNEMDSETNNSKAGCEREVVDLTLSSSDREEVAKKVDLNCSDVSTIPPPTNELGINLREKENADANDSIPNENSYISNVWDDFDYISDVGYVVHGGQGQDPTSFSPKHMAAKDSENVTSNVSVVGDSCQKSSPGLIHEVSHNEFNVSIDVSHRNDKIEENLVSPTHEEISEVGNNADGYDLTEKLLNVSLQKINDSIFWRDENEPVEGSNENKGNPLTPKTPFQKQFCGATSKKNSHMNSSGSNSITRANVTPLADFSAMKTPRLHKELDRYGIKHLKRNQAKKILRHIYNELHPIVSASSEGSGNSSSAMGKNGTNTQLPVENHKSSQLKENKKISNKSFNLSSDEHSSSDDSSDCSSDSVILEESIYEQMESPVKDITLSQKACAVDIPTGMKILIEKNPALHRKILFYEPVWLNEIKLSLKEVGAKFNVNQLMDYLDEQCITFRLASGNRHRRKRGPSAKSVSLSQPCNSRAKRCDTICSSQPC